MLLLNFEFSLIVIMVGLDMEIFEISDNIGIRRVVIVGDLILRFSLVIDNCFNEFFRIESCCCLVNLICCDLIMGND